MVGGETCVCVSRAGGGGVQEHAGKCAGTGKQGSGHEWTWKPHEGFGFIFRPPGDSQDFKAERGVIRFVF